MSEFKGIEIEVDWRDWVIGVILIASLTDGHLFLLGLGPLKIAVNKPRCFKNGLISFEIN